MIGRLQIGPLEWQVQPAPDADVFYSGPAYDGIWLNESVSGIAPPLVSVPLTLCRKACAAPSGEPFYSGGKNWAMWEEGRNLIFCAGFYEQPIVHYYIPDLYLFYFFE